MPKIRNCQTCEFFVAEPQFPTNFTGTCRRNPPMVITEQHLDENRNYRDHVDGPFPPAGAEGMWCGEYNEAK